MPEGLLFQPLDSAESSAHPGNPLGQCHRQLRGKLCFFGLMAPSALEPGEYVFEIALPTLKLSTGSYYLDLGLRSDRGVEDHIVQAIHFEVLPNAESVEALIHHRRGHVIPEISFSMRKLQARRDIHSGTAAVSG